jgi:hypothetical protein
MRASRLPPASLSAAAFYRPMTAMSFAGADGGPEVLQSLFKEQFQDYFGGLLGGNALWLFCHVPKTAGSSLNGELLPLLKPAFHIFIDYAEVDAKPYAELFDDAVGRFIDAAHLRRYRYATGHILAEHVERIASEVANVRPITLLRDPVARFVSDYRYQRSPMHPGHEAFSAQFPTIEPYLELSGEWNKIAAHLLPQQLREEADPRACADYLIATFAFIGIQELYPLTLRVLTTMAGSPQRPKVFRRLNAATPENPMELSAATEEAIRARNTLDIAIYDSLATRFRAISAGLEDYLDRVAPMRD